MRKELNATIMDRDNLRDGNLQYVNLLGDQSRHEFWTLVDGIRD